MARDAHVAKVAKQAVQLEAAQNLGRVIEGEARGFGELGDGEEAVALDEEEPEHGAWAEGQGFRLGHLSLPSRDPAIMPETGPPYSPSRSRPFLVSSRQLIHPFLARLFLFKALASHKPSLP